MQEVVIQKLVYGGQGLGELSDGRKVLVWNALPGERVLVRIIKSKRSYAEGVAEHVVEPSEEREEPRDSNYLATSPWQIMSLEAENAYKSAIVRELFEQEKVRAPSYEDAICAGPYWHYRNKMEYSFWGDKDGLHLALHRRGSHSKEIVQGSTLALPAIDEAAQAMLIELRQIHIRAGDLKTIVIRCNSAGTAVVALFVKTASFPKVSLPACVQGLRVYYSNPRSPASVPTELLYELGVTELQDTLLDHVFTYDVDSFFQVNLRIYEQVLERIREHCQGDPIDMYAGVGSIGISVARRAVDLIEVHPATAKMARQNLAASGLAGEVIDVAAEKALDCVSNERPVVFDPPRAGLHKSVIERCLEVLPPQILYLSCNPSTQARDLRLLQQQYDVVFFEVYNFFPRTPHIEALAVLRRKNV